MHWLHPLATTGTSARSKLDCLREARDLRLLQACEVTSAVAEDQQVALKEVVGHSLECTGATLGELVISSDPESSKRTVRALSPSAADLADEVLPTDVVDAWMVRFCKPLLLDSVAITSLLSDTPRGRTVMNMLAVPLIAGGELVGSLAMYNKHAGQGFVEADLRPLAIMATLAALIIDRHRLTDELQRVAAERDELASAVGVEVSSVRADDVEERCCAAFQERFAFTHQQARVALLLARRMTNQEVANTLFISPNTARRHTSAVLKKLGVTSRHAVTEALGVG